MKKHAALSAFAVVAAATLATAQPPAGTSQPQTQPRSATQGEQGNTVTLVGCLYREADVPGRQPNIVERGGILEDYILADARPAAGGQSQAAPGTTPGATGTTGMHAHTMYKVEHIADDRLRQLVGKRVEVAGRIDAEPGDTKAAPTGTTGTAPREDRSPGPDDVELPELEATSIREVPGTCPPKPSAPMRPGAPQAQADPAQTRPEEMSATGASQPQTQARGTAGARGTSGQRDERPTVTLVGCLYREADVPGRQPNVAERAGILEDYILAEIQAAAPGSSPTATPGATGTAGMGARHPMYKVEHIDDNRLRQLVGKRVEVTGRIDAEPGDTKPAPTGTRGAEPREDRSAGPDRIELPEFEATSIREVAGTCPATPRARQK